MRRLWAAAAAVLMCLALGLPALAQEGSGGPPTTVEPPTMPMDEVVFTGEATCGVGPTEEWLTSDPRVTGPCLITHIRWGSMIPGAVGDYTVNGPEGDWTGTWSLMSTSPTVARNLMVLEGTEAYEGWAVWAWAATPDGWQDGDPFDLEGVIYEGLAPSLQ